ncbi:hypothetical protein [Rhizobium sp. P28RR-XV]|uniref:hypothetical protein n=1 Tax=Rhizobium sp. P28RR-XV TaxID=2726737 RepID=UPI0014564BE3|nr:hypothetical protein [Rhizobium sp. P28RR-XV]NLR85749.1 hypothetical protein [Rhizobium sp. P28RR-XV]
MYFFVIGKLLNKSPTQSPKSTRCIQQHRMRCNSKTISRHAAGSKVGKLKAASQVHRCDCNILNLLETNRSSGDAADRGSCLSGALPTLASAVTKRHMHRILDAFVTGFPREGPIRMLGHQQCARPMEGTLRVRNRILQLHRANRLEYWTVPLPMEDERRLQQMLPGILRGIADPDIFEFVWQDSQIRIDDDFIVHYPTVEEWEWEEAMTCPVPHPHVWIETAAAGPDGADERIYIWDVTPSVGSPAHLNPSYRNSCRHLCRTRSQSCRGRWPDHSSADGTDGGRNTPQAHLHHDRGRDRRDG